MRQQKHEFGKFSNNMKRIGEIKEDGLRQWGELSFKVGRDVLGRVVFGASCLVASCLWGELSVIPTA